MDAVDPLVERNELVEQILAELGHGAASKIVRISEETDRPLTNPFITSLKQGTTRNPDISRVDAFLDACSVLAERRGVDLSARLLDRDHWRRLQGRIGDYGSPRVRQAQDGNGLGVPVRSVSNSEVLHGLGVHAAISVPLQGATPSPLTTYVSRDVDTEIAEKVQAAVSGSGLVVLIGESSTGKTRAAWEAIRALPKEWRVWHPLRPTPRQDLLTRLGRVTANTVVWLDELHSYLRGERAAVALGDLIADPACRPVLVMATCRLHVWDSLVREPEDGDLDPSPLARRLLMGREVRLPDEFGRRDRLALRSLASKDPRLALADERRTAKVTQFLAGWSEVMRHFHNGSRTARAIANVAIDARRLGVAQDLPREFLVEGVAGYVDDEDLPDEETFEQELTYLGRKCLGVPGPLSRVRRAYRLADQLEEEGRTARYFEKVPSTFWTAAVDYLRDPCDLLSLSRVARERSYLRLGALLAQSAFHAGSDQAAAELAAMAPAEPERLAWLTTIASRTDDAWVAWQLAYARYADGDDREGDRWLLRAVELDRGRSMHDMVGLLHKHGLLFEAAALLERIAATEPQAMRALIYVHEALSRPSDALSWHEKLAAVDARHSSWGYASALKEAGQPDEALAIWQRCAEAGDSHSMQMLGEHLVDAGDLAAGFDWLERAVRKSGKIVARSVSGFLRERDHVDEAVRVWLIHAEGDDHQRVWRAADQLIGMGRFAEARGLFETDAASGDEWAMERLADVCLAEGKVPEGQELLKQAVRKGHSWAGNRLNASFIEQSDAVGAKAFWEERTAAGDLRAAPMLAHALLSLGREQEADAGLRSACERGEREAMLALARRLRSAGNDEAERWYLAAEAAEAGEATYELAHFYEESGQVAEAIEAHERAYIVGHSRSGSRSRLVDLLRSVGRDEEADEISTDAAERGLHRGAIAVGPGTARPFGIEPGGKPSAAWVFPTPPEESR